ncbi:MAG: hypothetical protein FWC36_09475 [Spirochaetes bacterium]|nr:hypothetical protein [Spirochaetota bacterium]
MENNGVFETKIKKEFYILEKIYDKYKMEISRKDRLESKAIGYYMVTGISLAAFLVVELSLLSRGMVIKFSLEEILSIINFILCLCYLLIFIFLIVTLHNSYKPKSRPEFDPIDAYQKLKSINEDDFVTYIKEKLVEVIDEYERNNENIAKKLQMANNFCLANMFLIVAIFVILFLDYFL